MSAKRNRVCCAVFVKHADRHLAGWLAWHLAIGIDHIAIVTPNPSGATQQVLSAYQDHPSISWLAPELAANLSPEERRLNLTRQALRHLRQVAASLSSPQEDHSAPAELENWVLLLDADEYLSVEPDLEMRLCFADPRSAALALHWRIYGSAGHLIPPNGHVVANHIWHAPKGFYDHHVTRYLVRLERIPDEDTITNPFTLNIPSDAVSHANGERFQATDEHERKKWEGGCILHYICAQAHDDELSPAMRAYYDRNEVMSPPEKRQLHATRLLAHNLSEIALTAGLEQLKKHAQEHAALEEEAFTEAEALLDNHTQHATFSYTRSLPTRRDSLLLNTQFAAPYEINNTFLLRTSEGRLLECDEAHQHQPLIAVWQEQFPDLISLYIQDDENFALGDALCPFHIASMKVTYDSQVNMIRLPHETEQDNSFLELVPSSVPLPFLFTPLPPADSAEGLSLHGLLIWLEGHPNLHPVDLSRALLKLSPEAAKEVGELVPLLSNFLPLPTPKPAFML